MKRVVLGPVQSVCNCKRHACLLFIAVPGKQRFARGVVEHPAITCIHTVLVKQIAGDVIAGHAVERQCL